MMATQTGLFQLLGETPEQVREKYQESFRQDPTSVAQQTLLQQVVSGMTESGGRLGYLVGRAFGGKVPGEEAAEKRQLALKEAMDSGLTGSALYFKMAQMANEPQTKIQLLQLAQQAKGQEIEQERADVALQKERFDLSTAKGSQNLQQEILKLNQEFGGEPPANDPTALAEYERRFNEILYKFGSPDKVWNWITTQRTAKASMAQKAALQQDNQAFELKKVRLAAELRAEGEQKDREFRQRLADAKNDLDRQKINLEKSKWQTKQAEKRKELEDEKFLKQQKDLIYAQNNKSTFDAVDSALRVLKKGTKLDWSATGIASLAAEYITDSDANKIARAIEAVQANIGFDRLQQMRETSANGSSGLGQLAIQEMIALQRTSGNLSRIQDPKELARVLLNIKYKMQNINDVLTGKITTMEQLKDSRPLVRTVNELPSWFVEGRDPDSPSTYDE